MFAFRIYVEVVMAAADTICRSVDRYIDEGWREKRKLIFFYIGKHICMSIPEEKDN